MDFRLKSSKEKGWFNYGVNNGHVVSCKSLRQVVRIKKENCVQKLLEAPSFMLSGCSLAKFSCDPFMTSLFYLWCFIEYRIVVLVMPREMSWMQHQDHSKTLMCNLVLNNVLFQICLGALKIVCSCCSWHLHHSRCLMKILKLLWFLNKVDWVAKNFEGGNFCGHFVFHQMVLMERYFVVVNGLRALQYGLIQRSAQPRHFMPWDLWCVCGIPKK